MEPDAAVVHHRQQQLVCRLYQCDGRYLSGSSFYGKTTGQSTGTARELFVFCIGYYFQQYYSYTGSLRIKPAVTVAFSAEERPAAAGIGDPDAFTAFGIYGQDVFAVTSDRPGAGRGCRKRLFFTPAGYVVFVVEVAVYLILQLRESQERSDRLESGQVFRTFVGLAVAVTLAALLLGCLLVAGYLPGSDKVSEAANGRLALWKVTILTYGKEGLLFQIFGMGPDSFYYALYQWGSDAMDWINRGLLDNNIYSNAHNEWLTLLVQQGILGAIAYGGIFLTAFRNLRISATRDPRALAVFLGLTGYLICSLFTFQHVLSTPFAFALLGMAEGVFM